jgi:hypothetical protein
LQVVLNLILILKGGIDFSYTTCASHPNLVPHWN